MAIVYFVLTVSPSLLMFVMLGGKTLCLFMLFLIDSVLVHEWLEHNLRRSVSSANTEELLSC